MPHVPAYGKHGWGRQETTYAVSDRVPWRYVLKVTFRFSAAG